MIFKTAYLKLTAFYALIIMVISIGFSVAIYQISFKELRQGFGEQAGILRDLPLRNNLIANDLERLRLRRTEESSNNLKEKLIYFNLLILLLSSVAGYFLAKWTLRPIEEAVESQDRFTADASHELKTPLTAMRSEIEVNLRNGKMNLSDAKKLLNSNLEEIGKLESLSNALLKLAKFQEELRHEFKIISLPEVVTEAYEKVEKLAKEKSIIFENSFKDIKVFGDRESLIELFVIFLDNAIKYSPQKSKILIEIKEENKHSVVTIQDYGVGIKASDMPHIFDRFYRADHSRSKEKTNGYGLGLSIAKNIIDLHKGNISVKSIPDRGSEFKIKF